MALPRGVTGTGQELAEHVVLLELAHEFVARLGAQVVAEEDGMLAEHATCPQNWVGFRGQ